MNNQRVVITGIGVVAPNGVGIDAFTEALRSGKSGIQHFPEHENLNFRCQIGGLPKPDEEYLRKYLPPFYLEKIANKGVIFACLAGLEAWKNAKMEIDPNSRIPDAGIIIGAGALGWDNSTDWIQEAVNSGNNRKLGSRVIPQNMNSAAAAHLNQLLGLGYSVYSNSSACITGSEAVLQGYNEITAGRARMMIVGSTEGEGRYSWGAFDAMRVLVSDSNEQPTTGSRPMSHNSAGFAPGCGAGALVLETLESAQERGAYIYAEVLGGAQNCGGMRNGGTMTAPNSDAVIECIEKAIINTKVDPKNIDLISGHLTSTKADPLEINNWIKGLNLDPEEMPFVNTPKSMIGHCIAGAGSIESVACVIQLDENFIHPNINLSEETIHPEIKRALPTDKIPLATIEKEINTIIKANFGFGDLNCCLVFTKFKP